MTNRILVGRDRDALSASQRGCGIKPVAARRVISTVQRMLKRGSRKDRCLTSLLGGCICLKNLEVGILPRKPCL
jgi:hypothetical protein